MRPTRPRRPRPTSRRRSRGARGERGERSPAGIVSRKRTGTRRPSVVTTTATSSRLSFDRSTLLLPVGRFAESRRRSCRCPPMPMVPVERRTPSGRCRLLRGPVGPLRDPSGSLGAQSAPFGAASGPSGSLGAGSISPGHGFAPGPRRRRLPTPSGPLRGLLEAPSASDPSPAGMDSRPAWRRRYRKGPGRRLRPLLALQLCLGAMESRVTPR